MSSTPTNHANPRVPVAEAAIRECVKDESPLVQLDATLSAYVNLAIQHGRLREAAEVLMQMGGTLLFLQPPPKVYRCSVPTPGEADYHDAPKSVH